jgi:hypothetical protein
MRDSQRPLHAAVVVRAEINSQTTMTGTAGTPATDYPVSKIALSLTKMGALTSSNRWDSM